MPKASCCRRRYVMYLHVWLVVLAGLAMGALVGCVNGLLIAVLDVARRSSPRSARSMGRGPR